MRNIDLILAAADRIAPTILDAWRCQATFSLSFSDLATRAAICPGASP
jgi:hypothetical protein